ncbi:MAG TPA: hypothetical protein VFV99_08275 [Kofleriaceae bacterium]|nr:hypothetical protein [Kofleriaceae bacterium]
MMKYSFILFALVGCDMLKPRVSDETIDAPMAQIDAAIDTPPGGPRFVRPAGTAIPPISDSAELVSQIKIFDGLNDNALATANGVVTRSTGKAAGASVMYWNFGSVPVEGNFVVAAPLYILANDDGTGTLTPRTDHPWLIDTIPGDTRYSPMRRVIYVPVTAAYAGEVIASIDALNEAIELGLVGEPKPAGTWRNIPVVPPGTKLELGTTTAPMESTKVYARGYVVDTLPLAIPQPLSGGRVPSGQEARLLSGVATGTPPVLPIALDAQPVFQYGIPAAPPTTTFNYTPVVTELDVRLATGVAPAAITGDAQLFARSASGSITGYYVDMVNNYVVTTTVSNKQLQFMDGAP